ncbi:MAG TPA: ABC transporter permease, partial [Nitriliruptorales bacterium]
MELVLTLRQGESLLVTLGIPLGVLVFFSVVDVVPTGDADPVEFLVPGVLAISVMSVGLVALAIQTAFERKYLVLKRLGGTPLPRWGLLAAKALAVLGALVVQTVLVLVVARLGLGWEAGGSAAAVLVGLIAGAATFSAIGLLLAGTIKAELVIGLANALFLILLVVSGLAFETDALPGPVAGVGAVLPSGALGAVLRDGLAGTWNGGALATLVAWGLAAGTWAARSFRWEPS